MKIGIYGGTFNPPHLELRLPERQPGLWGWINWYSSLRECRPIDHACRIAGRPPAGYDLHCRRPLRCGPELTAVWD